MTAHFLKIRLGQKPTWSPLSLVLWNGWSGTTVWFPIPTLYITRTSWFNPDDLTISYDQRWLSLWRERFADPLDDAETFRRDSRGLLTGIGDRTEKLEEVQGQYMGLIKITPAGWQHICALLAGLRPEEGNRLDMTSLFQRLIKDGVKISATPVNGRWCEVDCENDLRIYEEHLAEANGWSHDWRWEVAQTA